MTEFRGDDYGFLSPEEVLALDRQSVAYGARAKWAFHRLGVIIGLPDETSTEMADALSVRMSERIDKLDFDPRRQIGDHLAAVIEILGGNALQRSVIVTPVDEQAIHGRTDTSELGGVGTESGSTEPSPWAKLAQVLPGASPESPKVELSKEVKYWLARLYKDEAISQIANLTQDQFNEFVESLCAQYLKLKITRADKGLRAEQLRQFLSGESVKDIADQHKASLVALRLAYVKIAEGIARLASQEEISSLIPAYEEKVDEGGEPAEDEPDGGVEDDKVDLAEIVELSKAQTRWLGELLKDGEVLGIVRTMNGGQRSALINNICSIFDKETRPRRQDFTTERRLRYIRMFLTGSSFEAIGGPENMTGMAIEDQLMHARKDLAEKADPIVLTRAVYDARDGKDYSVEATAKD